MHTIDESIKELDLLLETDPVYAAKHRAAQAAYEIEMTCGACPEQYDVFNDEGDLVGYMRLRHGWFFAEYRGHTVYEAHPRGDGVFDDETERAYYLSRALVAIREHDLKLTMAPEEMRLQINRVDELSFFDVPDNPDQRWVMRDGRRIALAETRDNVIRITNMDGGYIDEISLGDEKPEDEVLDLRILMAVEDWRESQEMGRMLP